MEKQILHQNQFWTHINVIIFFSLSSQQEKMMAYADKMQTLFPPQVLDAIAFQPFTMAVSIIDKQ